MSAVTISTLFSGSSGNAALVEGGGARVLVDAGMSGKYIEANLAQLGRAGCELDAIFVTHEHIDHIKAVGILSRRYNLPIYATGGTWQGMAAAIGKVAEGNVRVVSPGEGAAVKDLCVSPFAISHDGREPVGYNFFAGGKKATVATDIGVMTKDVFDRLAGSETILLESNHDLQMLINGPYPYPLKKRIAGDKGHLSNRICAKVCVRLASGGTKKILLGHLSNENNRPEVAYQETFSALTQCGAEVGGDVLLAVAGRYAASTI